MAPRGLRAGFRALGFGRVIAQEVDGFAHFCDAVGQRLASLAGGQREELDGVCFVEIGGAFQHRRPLADRRVRPTGMRLDRDADGRLDLGGGSFLHGTHAIIRVGWIDDRLGRCGARRSRHRRGAPAVRAGKGCARLVDGCQHEGIADVPTTRIAAAWRKNGGRGGDRRVGCGALRLDDFERVAGDRLGRHVDVGDLVNEGGVGAVLEQPAHQIGKQVGMRADRRVDAAARAFSLAHGLMQRLAHAVKALELEAVAIVGHLKDCRHGMCIVRRELRVDAVGHRQQLARVGDVGDVGVGLACEHGVARQAERLRPLDFGIPVGALDQAHHDLAVEPLGERVEPVDDEGCARPIGLHDDAKTVPAGKLGFGKHALDDVERQIEAVGLLGVDIEPHAGIARGERQRQQPLAHHRQHGLLLRHLVARMDRRKLDRDARIAADVGAGGAAVQRRDRVGIGTVVADRVGLGARCLAQHVVGIEIALRRHRATAPHCFVDGAAEHELLAHFAHRRRNRGTDHRLAEPAHHGAQRAFDAALALVEHLAGEHQRPGRSVDEYRAGTARMRRPVMRRDLVADEVVHRAGVGHTQQRLGETHQRHALLGREPVGRQENLHQPRIGRGAHGAHQIGRLRRDLGALIGGERCLADKALHRFVFRRQVAGAHRGADRVQFAGHGGGPAVQGCPQFRDDCPDRFAVASGWLVM